MKTIYANKAIKNTIKKLKKQQEFLAIMDEIKEASKDGDSSISITIKQLDNIAVKSALQYYGYTCLNIDCLGQHIQVVW